MRFSRQGYWNGLPFPSPGDLPNPGIEPGSPALQADPLLIELQGKALIYGNKLCVCVVCVCVCVCVRQISELLVPCMTHLERLILPIARQKVWALLCFPWAVVLRAAALLADRS